MTEGYKRWLKMYPDNVNKEIKIPTRSMYEILEESAEAYANRTAIITNDDHQITFSQFKQSVDRLAKAWKCKGLHKGDRIGIMLPNMSEYFITYYAAIKLGLTIVQVNPNYTHRELLQILENSETKYLVVHRNQLEKVNSLSKDYTFKDVFMVNGDESAPTDFSSITELIAKFEPLNDKASLQIDKDVAVIQYTGGTTGKMKGVMLTHSNLVANVYQTFEIYGGEMKKGQEVYLTATPLYHVYAMTSSMNFGVYTGATNVLVERYDVDLTLEKIKRYKPTYFPGVPRMYNDFINHPDAEKFGLDCLRFCSCGSAPLPIEVIKRFKQLSGVNIAEGFGLSETSPSTHRNPPVGKQKIGSVGIPLPSTECKIVDDAGKEVPINEIGEVIIRGPQVMKGYWKNEEETAKALKDGWLYTADLGRQDEEGFFYIVGRKVEMIISNGFNVYPQEVENYLYELEGIKEVAVVGIPDQQAGEIVKAYIVTNEGATITEAEIKEHCYKGLTPYKIPRQFEWIDALPRNNVGKILKTKLLEKELANKK